MREHQKLNLVEGPMQKSLRVWCRHCDELLFEIRTKDKVDTKLEMVTTTGVDAKFTCKKCGWSQRFHANAGSKTEW